MIVVGIDLSLTSTGLAMLDMHPTGLADHATERIQSKGRTDATLDQRWVRLDVLAHRISQWTVDHGPDLVVIEAPAFSRQTGSQHDRSGLWWRVVTRILGECYPVAEVPPTSRAKYATGRGNAGKDEVLAATIRRHPHLDILGNDIADAVTLAAMGCHHHDMPPTPMPKTNAAALDKVRWPS